MRNLTIAIVAIAMTLTTCNSKETKHFITDEAYRTQVETDFEARKELAQGRSTELFSVFDEKLTLEETEALKFLYAYMPYHVHSDLQPLARCLMATIRIALRNLFA